MRIAYVDSSVVVSYYLPDEVGHSAAVAVFDNADVAIVTATLTRIEVSGALVRASRTGRVQTIELILDRLDDDFDTGLITMVAPDPADVHTAALSIVRTHGLRALDAIHIATAQLALPELIGPHDEAMFISRDTAQADVAASLGLAVG